MKTDTKTEVIAGVTTFFTMAYIVIVNPAILSTPGTGITFSGAMTATVLLAFLMTMLMGLYAKLPFAVAPGMGLNAFFTFSVVLGAKVPWQVALGAVFWSGVLFLLVSLTGLREQIARAIPKNIRTAAACGIGLFLAFIGLKNWGLVVADPVTFVKLGNLNHTVLFGLGGMIVTLWLMHRKSPFAFLGGIFVVTAVALGSGDLKAPESFVSSPDFSSMMFKMDPMGALRLSLVPVMISILFTDLFDSISTFVGVSTATGLLDQNGEPKNLKQGLVVDSLATLFGGILGTSPGTAYIESTAGIEAGGRTGMTSVVTAFCFLPCLFLSPLAAMVPAYATAPTLVIVGALMFRAVGELKGQSIEDMIPPYLTLVMIPLTFSITQGLLWGFMSHTVLYMLSGRKRELHPMLFALALISAGLLFLEHRGA